MAERVPPAAILLAAAFVACARSSDVTRDGTAEVANDVLQSTTWQLVRFEGGAAVIEDGHLFLSLMADAGIYEYEPSSADGDSSGT